MAGPTVLIVDDDAPTLRALVRGLQTHGLCASGVNSMVDALVAMHREWPDVVVLDLSRAAGDPANLIEVIRQQRTPTRIALLVSGAEHTPPHYQAAALQADHVITKPKVVEPLVDWIAGIATRAAG